MRLVENEVIPRLDRAITDDEKLQWSLSRGRMEAEIVNAAPSRPHGDR